MSESATDRCPKCGEAMPTQLALEQSATRTLAAENKLQLATDVPPPPPPPTRAEQKRLVAEGLAAAREVEEAARKMRVLTTEDWRTVVR